MLLTRVTKSQISLKMAELNYDRNMSSPTKSITKEIQPGAYILY
ncbi:protein of unknown function [Vibrio tapetis subsp. tapetis]|uniref:Uncharacterized protein n=1 Tax=Vibrio tapetis subsp. tapetis TaxID=1671868 RepID=A0A2N8ZL42_9VIBR|nr:protein of unknown function [Vibrio tapetis subsp. tapetis]